MRSNSAIVIEELSKRYRIGGKKHTYSLREWLTHLAKGPFRRVGALLKNQPYQAMGLSEVIWALSEISFEVNVGEVVGIIGHNGSGKSTLLKILSRITEPTKGSASIKGRVASLLEVGTGFHPELSGRENVFLNGSILGMSRREIQSKFDEIVAFADIASFIDTPVKHYSSGMHVRLAFSVAAHLEPEILIIDEVLAVGDVRFQQKCLNKMENISSSGRTVLFVSHNMAAIQSLCQRAVLLDQGQLVKEGKATDVVTTYLQRHSHISSSKRWDPAGLPGNSALKVHCIEAVDNQGKAVAVFSLSRPVTIRIHYDVIRDGTRASFLLTLTNDVGVCVFSSLNNLEKKYYGEPLQKGSYLSECTIPADTLNDSMYFISVTGFNAQWSEPFTVERAIAIEAVDDGVLKGDYFGNYAGCVRPRLSWTTEKKNNSPEFSIYFN
ncbi:MAG: ABC transporter ATP-binding protein [Waddliaceae bacterium]